MKYELKKNVGVFPNTEGIQVPRYLKYQQSSATNSIHHVSITNLGTCVTKMLLELERNIVM